MSQPQRRDAIQCTTLITSYIRRLAGIIKSKAPNLDQKDLGHITAMLREVSRKESILARGKDLIRAHANAYQSLHKKDIRELEKRLRETTDPKKRKLIEEELIYQRRMIQAVDFLDKYETKIQEFIQAFNTEGITLSPSPLLNLLRSVLQPPPASLSPLSFQL
jgi:hypothetical protein